MKKLFSIFALLFLSLTLVACKDKEKDPEPTPEPETSDFAELADGYYFAADDAFSNSYRYYVVVKVKDGKAVDIKWDGYHIDMGASKTLGNSKFVASYEGLYGMDKAGNNTAGKWYHQAERAASHMLLNQQVDDLTFDDEGNTDEVAGITIHYSEFYDLVKAAIAKDPVASGDYNDGFYYVENESDYMMTTVVVNGKIVLADINSKYYKEYTVDGETKVGYTKDSLGTHYGMAARAEKGEWNVQAARVEDYLIANQDLNISLDAAGDSDDIADVTITESSFVELFDLFTAKNSLNSKIQDGMYFAIQENFSKGYKYYVVLTLVDGNIVDTHMSAVTQDGVLSKCEGYDKYSCSVAGLYGMEDATGNTKGAWHTQVDRILDHVLLFNSLEVSYDETTGDTDEIADVTIHVNEYFELAKAAIENGPVSRPKSGALEDGYYYVDGSAEATNPEKFNMGTFLVVNGRIVYADLNAAHTPKVDTKGTPDDTSDDVTLYTKDAMGDLYGMANADGNVAGEWYVQVERIEEYIIAKQNLNVTLDANGETDDIADVTIGIDGQVAIFDAFKALATPTAE